MAGMRPIASRLSRLIRDQGAVLQAYPVALRRSRELARELDTLNRTVAEAARTLGFEDEPSSFLVTVERSKSPRKRRAR